MNYTERVNQHLDRYLSNQGSLTEAMRYSVLSGGKRFRPILTYTVANTFGTSLDLADSSACAVELIHAYSLIHDDLPAMDDDDIRHNQPACHKKFGEAQAILTGDGLQALAFEVLASDQLLPTKTRINTLQALTHAAFEMAEGQSIDLGVASKTIGIETLKNMHRKKTGALLSCSVQLGVLVSGCSNEDAQILNQFSEHIGLAYQIQDDVLDVLTPEEVLGKKQHSDIDKNKPTYPSLLGLSESKAEYESLYQQAFSSLGELSVDTTKLQALTKRLQSRAF
ncbi:MAG: geranyl transferase [Gammaproteobacteria bacterium]|uniref:Farnesyl diphosphate synthase n=1 Tax=endosymbiont of Bathymodiolus septemdierum str. Myojin knoll TaxID=1303921 RepID=A0A0P0UR80_9GAMM|nr:farnesyl diphosphate synthase [Bathymodiolus septemdierum thioautotrophic gill symbiont]RUA05786.1 MAG: geranyl transferase [Gammaproteobacteria bacterium]BAS67726.1 farnesyl diphosphate synthase [endosymbiont of Bathymodiolus septemdierum str. Myojin knoll]